MIDVVHHLSTIHRQVGERTLGAGEARVVTISRTYDADVEDVWDACTDPARIVRWFLPVTGDLVVGGRYQLEGNAGGTIRRCHPPTGFAATWEFGDQISEIEVRLAAAPGGGTRLELEHTVPVDGHWGEFGPGAVGVGWDLSLVGLTLHLTSGAPVDPAEVAAWTASPDGRSFITRSSDAWGAAHAASGVPADAAAAAAARTTAAYTGEGGEGA